MLNYAVIKENFNYYNNLACGYCGTFHFLRPEEVEEIRKRGKTIYEAKEGEAFYIPSLPSNLPSRFFEPIPDDTARRLLGLT